MISFFFLFQKKPPIQFTPKNSFGKNISQKFWIQNRQTFSSKVLKKRRKKNHLMQKTLHCGAYPPICKYGASCKTPHRRSITSGGRQAVFCKNSLASIKWPRQMSLKHDILEIHIKIVLISTVCFLYLFMESQKFLCEPCLSTKLSFGPGSFHHSI